MTTLRRAYVALSVACVAFYALVPGLAGRIVYTAFGVPTVCVLLIAVRRYRPRKRTGWFLVAGSLVAWYGSAIVANYYTYVAHRPLPVPSLYDAFNLTGYGLLLGGLLVFLLGRGLRLGRVGLLDVAILSVAAGGAVVELLIDPVLGVPGLTGVARILTAGYPALDIAELVLLFALLIGDRRRPRALSLVLLATAVATVGDIAVALSLQQGAYAAVHWVMVCYMISGALWGTAALSPSMRLLSERQPADSVAREATGLRLAGLWAAFGVGPLLALLEHVQAREMDVHLLALWCVLTVLAMLRLRWLIGDKMAALDAVSGQERYFRQIAVQGNDLVR